MATLRNAVSTPFGWVLFVGLLWGATTRAQTGLLKEKDWLVELSPSNREDEAKPAATTIQYPREGLPAVVLRNGVLVARVKLPVPLTPPPGNQRRTALMGFEAQLSQTVRSQFGADQVQYELPAVDVRPDSQTSLVYRVSVPIPAWVADGTYTLSLTSPGSRMHSARHSVRVVSSTPVVARVALANTKNEIRRQLERMSVLPVDVWVLSATPLLLRISRQGEFPAPLLFDNQVEAVLKVGSTLMTVGMDVPSAPTQVDHYRTIEGVEESLWAEQVLTSRVVLPEKQCASFSKTTHWFPSTNLTDHGQPIRALALTKGRARTVACKKEPFAIRHSPAVVGASTLLSADKKGTYFWAHGDASYVGSDFPNTFLSPKTNEVAVLRISKTGQIQTRLTSIWVEQQAGCRVSRLQRPNIAGILLLVLLVWTIGRHHRIVPPKSREFLDS